MHERTSRNSRCRPRRAGPNALDREAVLRDYEQFLNRGLARIARLTDAPVEVRSEGCRVSDEEGKEYLECGGYAVFLTGHGHPRIVRAVGRQLRRNPLSSRGLLLNPVMAEAARCLASVAPEGLSRVFFTNSGTEATEAALKLARLSGKTRVVSTHGGFHGKSIGALSVTGRPAYRAPFEPLMPGVTFVRFGDANALSDALGRDPGRACVIVEPVQAEGGVVVPPGGYLRDVRAACDRADALMILDEIQTGCGRLGTWWGADREGIVPDILLAGKALGGGVMPVAAVVATPEVFAPLDRDPLLHTSTFAGNPLAMAAVRETLAVIREEGLPARAGELGDRILQGCSRITAECCPGAVTDVRGVGLLIGIEFRAEHIAGDFLLGLRRRNVLVCHSLNAHRVVRMTPPAVLSDAECQWLLEALRGAAAEIGGRY